MQKRKILIASSTKEESLLMKKHFGLMGHELGEIKFFETLPMRLDEAPIDMDLVVLNTDNFNPSLKRTLVDFKLNGYAGPTVVLAKTTSFDPLQLTKQMEQVVFLEKPYETKDFVGITRKLMSTRKVSQRIHRRYYTAQPANIEFYTREVSTETVVMNLSKGGAYLEIAAPLDVKNGDLLRLNIQLEEVSRNYAMPAKVIWYGPMAKDKSSYGLGVEFVPQGDVYRILLGDL